MENKELYTYKELKEKFQLKGCVSTDKQVRVNYFKKNGIWIEPVDNRGGYTKNEVRYKILDNQYYTFPQLIKKFEWPLKTNVVTAAQEKYAQKRGVIIEAKDKTSRPIYYEIKEILFHIDKEDYWKIFPKNSHFEVSKEGYVRNAENKTLLGHKNKYGYIIVSDDKHPEDSLRDYRVNRMVMETWKPIDNPENYVVDHINGIKTDNRVENLRWLIQKDNTIQRDENFALLNDYYQVLVELYGYDEIKQIFEDLINSKEREARIKK